MDNAEAPKNTGPQARYIAIELRLPALFALAVLVLTGFVLCFWIGVLVGEGDDKIKTFIPPSSFTVPSESQTAVQGDHAPEKQPLPPEELIFQERLRQNAGMPEDQPPPAVFQDPTETRWPLPLPASAPAGGTPSRSGAADQIFQYQCQVASYNRREQATELASLLTSKNFNASVETINLQGTFYHRVLITFQGTEEALAQLRQRMKQEFKLDGILQRSKKPVSR